MIIGIHGYDRRIRKYSYFFIKFKEFTVMPPFSSLFFFKKNSNGINNSIHCQGISERLREL
jgi:hypothetical protein